MPLLDKLQKDMVAAMKAKEELKLGTIRMVKTALMKEKVDSMKELDEAAEMRILNMLLKQRRESVEMYRQGGARGAGGEGRGGDRDHRGVHAGDGDGRRDWGGDRGGSGRNRGDDGEADGAGDEGGAGAVGWQEGRRAGAE